MSTQQKIHVKLQYNNEFRRFIIEPELNINDLKQQISSIVHLTAPFTIYYLDEESEWITIDSDIELKTGLELSPALLRIKIELTSTQQNPPQDLPNPVVEEGKHCRGKWRKNKENCGGRRFERNTEECGERKEWRKRKCERNANENQCDDEKKEWRMKRWGKVEGECGDEKKDWKECGDEKKDWKECKKEWKARGGHCGRGGRRAWMNRGPNRFSGLDNSDSDSLEDKPVEEMKNEIKSLKEEIVVLVTKKKGVWAELVELKSQIKTLRQNEGVKEDIVKLREQIVEKKRVVHDYQAQIANSKNRIWKLKRSLEVKIESN